MTREKLPGTRVGLCKRIWLRYADPEVAGENGGPKIIEVKIYVHTGEYEDGRLGEVFIKAAKMGSLISGLLDTASISISLGLQHGVPLDSLLDKYLGLSFETGGSTSDEKMPRVTSITDAVARWLRVAYPDGRRAPSVATPAIIHETQSKSKEPEKPLTGTTLETEKAKGQ